MLLLLALFFVWIIPSTLAEAECEYHNVKRPPFNAELAFRLFHFAAGAYASANYSWDELLQGEGKIKDVKTKQMDCIKRRLKSWILWQ